LRYTIGVRDGETGDKKERRLYVKVYRQGEGEQSFEALRAVWDGYQNGRHQLTVGRPIGYFSRLGTVFQEEAAGTSLQDVLLHGSDTVAAMRTAARAVAAFQHSDSPPPRQHGVPDQVDVLKRTERFLRWGCTHLRPAVEAVASEIVSQLAEVEQRPTHRDLKTDHVLLDGDRVALIDLDSFARSDPVLDPATLLAHVSSLPLRYNMPWNDRLSAAARAFDDEYFTHVPAAWRRRLPIQYAASALKEAASFLRRQEPGWPQKAAAMVGSAEASLAGRLW
jgi:Ser/Thr protein kinase RdoA (MazF antagonist)